MRLTTKGRFAVTAMVDLAMRGGKAPVTLAAISERQKISLSYLERPGSKISIAEIVVAVDEPLDATKCGGKGDCHGDQQPCITHDLWMGLNEKIYSYLEDISLQQLVDSNSNRNLNVTQITLKKAVKPVSIP